MRALFCLQKPPPPPTPPPPPSSSSSPRTRTRTRARTRTDPQTQTTSRTLIPNKPDKPRSTKLEANPKGFAAATTTTPKEPSRRAEKPLGASDPEDPPIPQEVFERMMVRIVVSVGTPLATGVAILKLLGMLRDRNVWDVPLWVPYATTLLTFGASALGIAYGSLSTSLDPNSRGSLLGLGEAKDNWAEMWKDD